MISVKLALDRQLLDDDLLERTVHRVRRKLAYLLDDLHAFLHLPEYRVLAVEPRRRHERYEELRAAGVRPRVRHREHAGLVVAQPLAELVLDDVARAAGAVALRAAALDHELVDDAVEGEPVVEALLREVGEVLDRVRREVVVKLDLERAVVRLKHRGLSRGLGGLRRLRREGGERRRRDHCAESKNFHHGSPPFRHVDQLLHFII